MKLLLLITLVATLVQPGQAVERQALGFDLFDKIFKKDEETHAPTFSPTFSPTHAPTKSRRHNDNSKKNQKSCRKNGANPAKYMDFTSDDAATNNDCLGVKGGTVEEGQPLVLGNGCLGWRVDQKGLFHSEVDDCLCMQVGQGEDPVNGKKVRLAECDNENYLQKFEYDGTAIRLMGTNFCVVFQGESGDKGDPIIVKKCNDVTHGQINWSKH